jgi:hypothetical protein
VKHEKGTSASFITSFHVYNITSKAPKKLFGYSL